MPDRYVVTVSKTMREKVREFVGRTTDEGQIYFFAKLKRHQFRTLYILEPFVEILHQKDNKPVKEKDIVIQQNLDTIKSEVKLIVS